MTDKLAKAANIGTPFELNGHKITVKDLTYRQIAEYSHLYEGWEKDGLNTLDRELEILRYIFKCSSIEVDPADMLTASMRHTDTISNILIAAGIIAKENPADPNAPADEVPLTTETSA
jgi:hypothetical protein